MRKSRNDSNRMMATALLSLLTASRSTYSFNFAAAFSFPIPNVRGDKRVHLKYPMHLGGTIAGQDSKARRLNAQNQDREETDNISSDIVLSTQQTTLNSSPPPPREPDSPDRALAIVSELKSNAALFAAFAYGGLSIPSILTVTESKVTSVTTSISTARPLPSNDLIQTFLVLDVATLCLMISCVAACQLLIYRLTDGSWFIGPEGVQRDYEPSQSAMGRLVQDYGLEFTVARTTFDLGLVALLLAVAVRAVASFDESISLPIVTLLGGTCILLAAAYLQSYLQVFRRLEQRKKKSRLASQTTTTKSILLPSSILLAMIAVFFSFNIPQGAGPTPQTSTDAPKSALSERISSYSNAAGETKLRSAVDKVAEEKATRGALEKESTRSSSSSSKKKLSKSSKIGSKYRDDAKEGGSKQKQSTKDGEDSTAENKEGRTMEPDKVEEKSDSTGGNA